MSREHPEDSPEALEFWIAIAAGEPVWADPDDEVPAIARLAAFIEIFALSVCITITWTGALLFTFIIAIYLIIQSVINHLRHESTEYINLVGFTVFMVALAIYAPVWHKLPL